MKVFIVIFRLMLLYFGLRAVSQLFWLLSAYVQMVGDGFGEMSRAYTLQIWGVIGHLLFLGVLVAAWLMPRKCLGVLPSDIDQWPDDIQQLSDKLPQLVVFGIGLMSLLSSIVVAGNLLFEWLMTRGTAINVMTFGPRDFWMLLIVMLSMGIPLLMMFYSKPVSRFFIK